jgi:hypothetical protein
MSPYAWQFYNSIKIGDIVADFCPVQQRHIHYLVVDHKKFDEYDELFYHVLHPLDSGEEGEIKFYFHELQNRFSTMKVVA